MLLLEDLEPGDIVHASTDLYNDGTVPELADDALLAERGSKGVLLNSGHLEDSPDQIVYLVRFENPDLTLGPPVACWPEELTTKTSC